MFRGLLSSFRNIWVPLKPVLEAICDLETRMARNWGRSAHRRLMTVQFGIPPQPENFDHHIDLLYWWQESRNPQWVERGVYSACCLQKGKVLELCCGDGFNARNFYSLISQEVVACDFDSHILRIAQRKNAAPNIRYVKADIRYEMPTGKFENIIWDAAIEHFTEKEIVQVMGDIKERLSPTGILSGYTIVERHDGTKHLSHHEYEFKDKLDLLRFLKPHFRTVAVFETKYPERHNLYFWASDGAVPFSPEWQGLQASWFSA